MSWYTPCLEKSLEFIREIGISEDAQILDVGAGASTLPDDLLESGFKNITVLDISSEALKVSKDRLGNKAEQVRWLEADILQVSLPPGYYDFWHDRAVFHFLTERADRQKYLIHCSQSVKRGGYVLMATFGPNGPLKCSGLEIVRYSAENLKKEFGKMFRMERHFTEIHKTPFETTQEFLYALFRKVG